VIEAAGLANLDEGHIGDAVRQLSPPRWHAPTRGLGQH
jgi:hypothetical protein